MLLFTCLLVIVCIRPSQFEKLYYQKKNLTKRHTNTLEFCCYTLLEILVRIFVWNIQIICEKYVHIRLFDTGKVLYTIYFTFIPVQSLIASPVFSTSLLNHLLASQ